MGKRDCAIWQDHGWKKRDLACRDAFFRHINTHKQPGQVAGIKIMVKQLFCGISKLQMSGQAG